MKEFKEMTEEHLSRFACDSEYCKQFIAYKRWKCKPWCPQCTCTHIYTYASGYDYKCANKRCHHRFSVTSGTIFERSKIPLRKWFVAIEKHLDSDSGYAAYKLGKRLKIRNEASWFMQHRILELFMIDYEAIKKKGGIWEIDIHELGPDMKKMNTKHKAKYANRGGSAHRKPITVLVNRDGHIYAVYMKNRTKEISDPIVKNLVRKSATVYTDAAAIYNDFKDYFSTHEAYNRSKGILGNGKGGHINNANRECGSLENVHCTHRILSDKYLQRYLDEFCFKRNTRHLTVPEKFSLLFDNIERNITFDELKSR